MGIHCQDFFFLLISLCKIFGHVRLKLLSYLFYPTENEYRGQLLSQRWTRGDRVSSCENKRSRRLKVRHYVCVCMCVCLSVRVALFHRISLSEALTSFSHWRAPFLSYISLRFHQIGRDVQLKEVIGCLLLIELFKKHLR